ncbi:chromosome segregation DNA-binding protein [Moraxella cuniculi DSM 21768]|uniref:Probable chromosome-partitioning protein ParB n=2 Tax=Moraxella cuniculi TaxID=34061 RepID=A0A1N7EPI5_9GAMM|nr:ParB/RepB/Spo0J family partition protein [Moraxella cuniculi]OOS07695.1 chromosome partitioning protein ParB [Moraxella cuniculi]SIR89980.1 chromosome segregation DNA-binding protein [Moraxella cuniculi DSM 21768]VEG13524.1 Probable chromosome-partitioning protein parB [Moraxella cuniculi]
MNKKHGLGKRGLDLLLKDVSIEREVIASTQVAVQQTQIDADTAVLNQASASADDLGKSAKKSTKHEKRKNDKAKKAKKSAQLPQQTPTGEKVALVQIATNRLQSGKYQPRRDMNEEALNELALSIKQHGIMQPIVIRPLLSAEQKTHADITHEIIAGERRWRAAKLAGLESIPAIERVLSDETAIALALIENIQREDLNVLEQAQALQRFHTEFGMSHAMIASVVGKARTTVSNLMRLNHLHDEVKQYMIDGVMDMGHARALLSLSDAQQPIIAKKIVDGNLTVRDAERLVKSILNPEPANKIEPDYEILALSQQISDALGATVKLKQGKDGKGSVEIFFYDNDELTALINKLTAND